MARVSLVEKDQAHPMVKELYEKNEGKSGRILNLWKVMGRCPYIGLNFQWLGNSLLRGEELSDKLRELAVLRVGHLTQSRYEFRQHAVLIPSLLIPIIFPLHLVIKPVLSQCRRQHLTAIKPFSRPLEYSK